MVDNRPIGGLLLKSRTKKLRAFSFGEGGTKCRKRIKTLIDADQLLKILSRLFLASLKKATLPEGESSALTCR